MSGQLHVYIYFLDLSRYFQISPDICRYRNFQTCSNKFQIWGAERDGRGLSWQASHRPGRSPWPPLRYTHCQGHEAGAKHDDSLWCSLCSCVVYVCMYVYASLCAMYVYIYIYLIIYFYIYLLIYIYISVFIYLYT